MARKFPDKIEMYKAIDRYYRLRMCKGVAVATAGIVAGVLLVLLIVGCRAQHKQPSIDEPQEVTQEEFERAKAYIEKHNPSLGEIRQLRFK